MTEPATIRRLGTELHLPGIATAHSHAFQRALRGRTQRRTEGAGSFWSWRGLMYELADKLDPDTIGALSRLAFAELAMAGVTAVGEFHYVHHRRGGAPYDNRTAMAEAVIEAARDAGLRITLLRVLYHRAADGREPEGAQQRFCDPTLDAALEDTRTLAARFHGDHHVHIGLAPHSVRAVPRAWIREAAEVASAEGWPLHMHVAEQPREVETCVAEHGLRPVQMLAEDGALGERFVGVHATHLADDEIRALGEARAFACICRTTERDLGDGLPRLADLVSSGARLCTGVDSHAVTDPFEDARAMELDERSRTLQRHAALEGPALLAALSAEGYAAIGMAGAQASDRVVLDAEDPALVGMSEDLAADAIAFAASPRAVRRVEVDGVAIVDGGRHGRWDQIRTAYGHACRTLGL